MTADAGDVAAAAAQAKEKEKDKEKAKKKKKKKKAKDADLSLLAPGWTAHYDESYKRHYFVNNASGETTWDMPEAPEAPESAGGAPPASGGPPALKTEGSGGNLALPTLSMPSTSTSPSASPLGRSNSSGALDGDPLTAVPQRMKSRERAASTSGIRGFHLTPQVRSEVERHSMIKFGKKFFRELKKPKTNNPVAEMLAYSKGKLADTVCMLPKQCRKVALNQYKYVQQYIGDVKTKTPPLVTLTKFVAGCFGDADLANEMFVYCIRATNNNPVKTSAMSGWELFALAVQILRPSPQMTGPLQAYCLQQMDSLSVPTLKLYASYCFRRLYYCNPVSEAPEESDIERMIKEPLRPSLFGGMLEDMMVFELSKDSNATVPRVIVALTEAIEAKNGFKTEGIFRIPADVQLLARIKDGLSQYNYEIPGRDPNVAAGLLKLWFRDMASPVVPIEFYDACIKARTSYPELRALIDQFPPGNAAVLEHLILFLQRMAAPEVAAVTKMEADNLAMVFAPNVIRQKDSNSDTLFAMATYQQDVLRTLIENYTQ